MRRRNRPADRAPRRRAVPDERDGDRVIHLLPDILRARIFAIACGYEDADDLDRLRFDPALKLACGRLPDTGRDLCSQPTVSRWENAPSLRDLIRLMGVMVDLYCASYPKPPDAVTLDTNRATGSRSLSKLLFREVANGLDPLLSYIENPEVPWVP
jgi:hypothetical protein